MPDSTIQYYEDHADEYASNTAEADMSECRSRFLKYIPAGGKILDAGCGSGRDSVAFLADGYDVDAFDASEKLCRLASGRTGIQVEKKRFEELEGEDRYDGIWACASLLHVEKEKLPDVLRRLKQLLKEDGVLYASFKCGAGERMQGDRYYNDMTENGCAQMMTIAGLSVIELFSTTSVLPGREQEVWISVISGKHAR